MPFICFGVMGAAAAAACTQEAEADESPEREASLEFQDKQSYRENPVLEINTSLVSHSHCTGLSGL